MKSRLIVLRHSPWGTLHWDVPNKVKSTAISHNPPPPRPTDTHTCGRGRPSALCGFESRSPVATLVINEREFIQRWISALFLWHLCARVFSVKYHYAIIGMSMSADLVRSCLFFCVCLRGKESFMLVRQGLTSIKILNVCHLFLFIHF